MNLPNYFLADLPSEATLSPSLISEACQTLRANRERYLLPRTTQSLINLLSSVAADWLQADFPLRKLALEYGTQATSFSPATLSAGLDAFFKQLSPENFHALLEQELGHPQRLDRVVATSFEEQSKRAALAVGPELLVHIAAGNLPPPTLMSIVLGILARSAQFVKCARGASLLPRLFAHSLYQADPKLGACLELAEWRGGSTELEKALFEEADCLTATGNDETLAQIKHRLPSKARFLGYGHRVSFGYISAAVLTSFNLRRLAACAANDVAAWNQLGCLSPHVLYVERGGAVGPEQFAALLAEELASREADDPRGELPPQLAGAIASRRALHQVRAAHSPETGLWSSPDSTAWTVVYEADPRFQVSCLNRFIYVKPAASLTEAIRGADAIRMRVSTVGLAAEPHAAPAMAAELGRWGARRVCPLGKMQEPPLTWRHDGRPALADLLMWTDYEAA